MRTERNAPCPCGSGKKYKKCCLAKDEAAERAKLQQAARVAAEKQPPPGEFSAHAEWEGLTKAPNDSLGAEPEIDPETELLDSELEDSDLDDSDFTDPDLADPESGEPDWPPLVEADQQLVDAWWDRVGPVYMGREKPAEGGWMLEQAVAFLDQHPGLFRYLHLHDEFLFELAVALARDGRMDEYLALLRRLRDEQPEMYRECFGSCDEDLLAAALRTGRRDQIPSCLNLFRQHPLEHIDRFGRVVSLLAWHGCEAELRDLLEATAHKIAKSSKVIGGDFALECLSDLAMFPFLEAGDASAEALERLGRAVSAVGLIDETTRSTREWLAHAVTMSSRTAAEAGLDLKVTGSKWLHADASWNFVGWLRRTRRLAWSSARFLAATLLDYWGWKERGTKVTSPFGLNSNRLDRYLAQCGRSYFGFSGLRTLSTLQAFHYFTEYLVEHRYFCDADASLLQAGAAELYETIRQAIDPSDAALQIYPSYQALVAAPETTLAALRSSPSSSDAAAGAPPPGPG